jgi:hypothetical protein
MHFLTILSAIVALSVPASAALTGAQIVANINVLTAKIQTVTKSVWAINRLNAHVSQVENKGPLVVSRPLRTSSIAYLD